MRRPGRPSSGRPAEPEPGRRVRRATPPALHDLEQILEDASQSLALPLPAAFPAQIVTYLDELERWQRVGPLTGYRSWTERVRHLVLESLMLLTVVPEPASPLLDIGSGPGVPGLILKLARPNWDVTLVEAARRRANFLRQAVRRLDLKGVSVYGERAEALALGPLAGGFLTVTVRAVAHPEEAVSLARPFLAPTGVIVLPVGPQRGMSMSRVRTVTLKPRRELPWRRQFLIIRQADLDADVPLGTG